MTFRTVFILLLLFPSFFVARAQLSFPNGKKLDLNTNINLLYFETEILFHTGKNLVDQYNWEKVSDSVDHRWLIGSCFNGDCQNGLPINGTFIKSFGINDTTGFIRFHVETYDTNGKSVIKYKVVNKNDLTDQAELTFNITFEKLSGINDHQNHKQSIILRQNALNGNIRIQFNEAEPLISGRIINLYGKTVCNLAVLNNEFIEYQLSKGLYIVELKSAKSIYTQKFIMN
jgi:hypothetical protein